MVVVDSTGGIAVVFVGAGPVVVVVSANVVDDVPSDVVVVVSLTIQAPK